MKNRNKNEKHIIVIACISTVAIVIGFTMMQGTIKRKEDKYVSQETNLQTEIELSKDSYEIVENTNLKDKNKHVVLQKKNLKPEEIAILAKEVVKENFEKSKLYIFESKDEAINFNGEENQIKKLVMPIKNNLQIQTYSIVENEIESTPKNYSIKSVKPEESITNIEIELESTNKPEKALAEIKFLGQSIKELNPNKDLGNLYIKAYDKDNKNISWDYSSENKLMIIKSEIVEM